MKVKALRGVCIGVDRHLAAGDTVDLEPGLVTYLVNIGAVALLKDEPPKPQPESPAALEPPTPETPPPSEPPTAEKVETKADSTPAKPAKKEK